jgi:hypothetical protein
MGYYDHPDQTLPPGFDPDNPDAYKPSAAPVQDMGMMDQANNVPTAKVERASWNPIENPWMAIPYTIGGGAAIAGAGKIHEKGWDKIPLRVAKYAGKTIANAGKWAWNGTTEASRAAAQVRPPVAPVYPNLTPRQPLALPAPGPMVTQPPPRPWVSYKNISIGQAEIPRAQPAWRSAAVSELESALKIAPNAGMPSVATRWAPGMRVAESGVAPKVATPVLRKALGPGMKLGLGAFAAGIASAPVSALAGELADPKAMGDATTFRPNSREEADLYNQYIDNVPATSFNERTLRERDARAYVQQALEQQRVQSMMNHGGIVPPQLQGRQQMQSVHPAWSR